MALTGPARVVDVGCGAGEFLIRVAEGSLETRAFQPLTRIMRPAGKSARTKA